MSEQDNKSTSGVQYTLNNSLTLDSIKLGLINSSPRYDKINKRKRTKSIYYKTPSKPRKKRVYFNPKLVVVINVDSWKKYNSGTYTFDDDSLNESKIISLKKSVLQSDCKCCILI